MDNGAVGLADAPLFEREEERSTVARVVDRALAGDGSAVVVEGEAGIGKTALLSECAARAKRRGLLVLSARCGTLERDFSFGVVRQLFEGYVRSLPADAQRRVLSDQAALCAPLLGFSRREVAEPLFLDPGESLLHGLYWLTVALQEKAPLLLGVDDAQWCDESSGRFLAYLAPRLDGLRVALLVTQRVTSSEFGPTPTDALGSIPTVGLLRLAPLSVAGTRALLAHAFGGPADDALATKVHEATTGNPFLLHALAERLENEAGAAALPLAEMVPDSVARSVALRLRGLGADANALARAIAVLEPLARMREAASVAGLSSDSATLAADTLVRSGLVAADRPLRFLHPLIAAAVYTAMAPGERAQFHGRAARALAAVEAPAGRVATHLLSTEPTGDPWVLARLDAAAHEAFESGAPDLAAKCWQRALEEGPSEQLRPQLMFALGRAEARAHRPEALEHLRQAASLVPPTSPVYAECAAELGRALLFNAEPAAALDLLDRAVASVGPTAPLVGLESELLAVARFDLQGKSLIDVRLPRLTARSETGDPASRLLLAHRALAAAMEAKSVGVCIDLACRALAEGALIAACGPNAPEPAIAAQALSIGEAFDEAESALTAGIERARRAGAVLGYTNLMGWRAGVHLRRGDFRSAEADAAACFEVSEPHALGIALWLIAPVMVEAQVARGALAEAEETLRLTGIGEGEPAASPVFFASLNSRASLRLARCELELALDDLALLSRFLDDWGCHNPSLFWSGSRAARVLVSLDRRDEARALAQMELIPARRFGAPGAIGLALQAAAAAEDDERGLMLLDEAVTLLQRSGRRAAHADALCDQGMRMRRARSPKAARDPLRRALASADACGAVTLAQRAREELVATGARPRRTAIAGHHALTPAERRVAYMASEGLSNREIAQALFLTVKTIEMHLTRAYRKLDVHARSELAAALSARAALPHQADPSP